MLGRLRALIVKELLAILRDPKGRMVLIGPPLMQLLIFSYAATLEVSNVDIAFLNHDGGRWGTELSQRIAASDTFREVTPITGLGQAREALDRRRVLAAVHVDPEFSRDIEAGRRPRFRSCSTAGAPTPARSSRAISSGSSAISTRQQVRARAKARSSATGSTPISTTSGTRFPA